MFEQAGQLAPVITDELRIGISRAVLPSIIEIQLSSDPEAIARPEGNIEPEINYFVAKVEPTVGLVTSLNENGKTGFQSLGEEDSISSVLQHRTRLGKEGTSDFSKSQYEELHLVPVDSGDGVSFIYGFKSPYYHDDIGRPGNLLYMGGQISASDYDRFVDNVRSNPDFLPSFITEQMRLKGAPEAAEKMIFAHQAEKNEAPLELVVHKSDFSVSGREAIEYKQTEFSAEIAVTTDEVLPWDNTIPTVPTKSKEKIKQSYNSLLSAEASTPDPNQKYRARQELHQTEKDLLEKAGILETGAEKRDFTRQELQAAGFFFVNRLGEGEKGIIEAVIPDGEEELDLRNRNFLTRDELNKVYSYQQQSGDGLRGHDVNAVRADALLFLESIYSEGSYKNSAEAFHDLIPTDIDDDRWQLESITDKAMVGAFVESLAEKYTDDGLSEDEAYTRIMNDLEVRPQGFERFINLSPMRRSGIALNAREGRSVTTIFERYGKLAGQPSPFLDSGFIFSGNPDIMLELENGEDTKMVRMNMANIHIMGGHPDFIGLSEMGSKDWDQEYITTGEYVESVYAGRQSALGMAFNQSEDLLAVAGREEIRAAYAGKVQQNLLRLSLSVYS